MGGYAILLSVRVADGTSMKTNKNRNDDPYNDPGLLASFAVPVQMIAYILGGAALGLIAGHFIDDALHTSAPIATFLGLLLGLAAGVFLIVRFVSSLK
jgi:F0F1-type ATP synthase assembly protein I